MRHEIAVQNHIFLSKRGKVTAKVFDESIAKFYTITNLSETFRMDRNLAFHMRRSVLNAGTFPLDFVEGQISQATLAAEMDRIIEFSEKIPK